MLRGAIGLDFSAMRGNIIRKIKTRTRVFRDRCFTERNFASDRTTLLKIETTSVIVDL